MGGWTTYPKKGVTPPKCAPTPRRDGIVNGTSGNDRIDQNYVDRDGDRVDANDAILPGDAPNDDRIYGGAGNDWIAAGKGDDLVYGGTGKDTIYGGTGADTLYGDADDDLIYGEAGRDALFGGAGRDTLYGGDDRDTLSGGAGSDVLFGGRGNDLIYADASDTVFGGADRDTIIVDGTAFIHGGFIDGDEEGDDWDTLDLSGAGPFRIVYDSENRENGRVHFYDESGKERGHLDFRNIENIVPCFTPGAMIATPKGEVPVEALRPGDRVITRDNGIREIVWTGERSLSTADLRRHTHLQPIWIRANALGDGLPERDMLVSPNHRVLVANDRTQLYFDEHEVLVAAKHLRGLAGVKAVQSSATTYIHFMCENHEVVLSDGAWTESFQPGDHTLRGMGNAQRNEIFEIFPDLRLPEGRDLYTAARRTLKGFEARLLTV